MISDFYRKPVFSGQLKIPTDKMHLVGMKNDIKRKHIKLTHDTSKSYIYRIYGKCEKLAQLLNLSLFHFKTSQTISKRNRSLNNGTHFWHEKCIMDSSLTADNKFDLFFFFVSFDFLPSNTQANRLYEANGVCYLHISICF